MKHSDGSGINEVWFYLIIVVEGLMLIAGGVWLSNL
jgi:hypothetical protein